MEQFNAAFDDNDDDDDFLATTNTEEEMSSGSVSRVFFAMKTALTFTS
jgi:hypothetical protein